jgi:excisionase family DNA binding protein
MKGMKEWMSPAEAAVYLRVCETTVRRLCDTKKLRYFLVPRPDGKKPTYRRISRVSVLALMDECGIPPLPEGAIP